MTSAPLLLLSAACALAGPRPSGEPPAGRPDPSDIDPSVLTADARTRWEADPAGFEREHGEDLQAQRRWSQDPALGQAECREARRDPRSCMEERVRSLAGVVKPQALAVINSYVKLLPRGVSAPVPASEADRAEGVPAAAREPAASPAPGRQATANPPRPSGARFNAPPPAQPPAAPAPAPAPGGGMSVDQTLDWLCSFIPCART